MKVDISPEMFKTVLFALNIAEQNCAPANREIMKKLQDDLLDIWEVGKEQNENI